MAQIIRSPATEADAADIWAHVAKDNPQAADRLIAQFDLIIHSLAEHPHSGKSVSELYPKLRLIPIGRYLLFYRPTADGIEIVRLLRCAPDVADEFFRA